MWSHEAEHGEGGNGREGGERNMAAIHGRTVQKDPNATDSFNENIYEDELEVMETEVKEALRHISNRNHSSFAEQYGDMSSDHRVRLLILALRLELVIAYQTAGD